MPKIPLLAKLKISIYPIQPVTLVLVTYLDIKCFVSDILAYYSLALLRMFCFVFVGTIAEEYSCLTRLKI